MKTYCFFDLETDNQDPKIAHVVEAAYAIYDERGRIQECRSEVFSTDNFNESSTEIHNITSENIKHGSPLQNLYGFFLTGFFRHKHEALIGHNVLNYDIPILLRLSYGEKLFNEKVIVDTMHDIEFKTKTTSKRLTHLCSDHEIPTVGAHGALTDSMLVASLFYKYDIAEIVERAKTPLVYVQANVNFNGRHLPKKHNFRWDGTQKIWWKRVRLFDRDKLLSAIGDEFEVLRLPESFKPSES